MTRMTGNGQADLVGTYRTARRLDARNPSIVPQVSGDFALLDDINTQAIRGSRITPRDRIVPSGAGAPLIQRTIDREPSAFTKIEYRYSRFNFCSAQQLGINAVCPHDVSASPRSIHLGWG